jgi:hypothetical protein
MNPILRGAALAAGVGLASFCWMASTDSLPALPPAGDPLTPPSIIGGAPATVDTDAERQAKEERTSKTIGHVRLLAQAAGRLRLKGQGPDLGRFWLREDLGQETGIKRSEVPLSKDGELLDAWNRLILVHQVSQDSRSYISAGSDGIFGTADDVTEEAGSHAVGAISSVKPPKPIHEQRFMGDR